MGTSKGKGASKMDAPFDIRLDYPRCRLVLQVNHTGKEAILLKKLVWLALFHQSAFIEYHDLVGIHDGSHAMGDDENRLASKKIGKSFLHL